MVCITVGEVFSVARVARGYLHAPVLFVRQEFHFGTILMPRHVLDLLLELVRFSIPSAVTRMVITFICSEIEWAFLLRSVLDVTWKLSWKWLRTRTSSRHHTCSALEATSGHDTAVRTFVSVGFIVELASFHMS